jgi:hypothetical protein
VARKLAVRTVVAWFGELSFDEQSSALAQLQDQHDQSRAAKRTELQKQLMALGYEPRRTRGLEPTPTVAGMAGKVAGEK